MKKIRVHLMVIAIITGCLTGCGSRNQQAGSSVSGTISVISREDGSGTRSAFVELFGIEEKREDKSKTDHTTKEAIIANGTGIVLTNVAGDKKAIGYVSLGSLNDTVKALKINDIPITSENVRNGTYEIARPFIIATNGSPSEATQDFIRYILSTEGQAIVESSGYIQVDQTAEAFDYPAAEGKIVISGSSSVTPVMEKLVESYKKRNPNVVIELQQNDSTTGLQNVLSNTADIGMASRNLKESESALSPTVIAIDGIAIIVNKTNTIDSLTTDEVNAIYTGKRISW